MTGAVQAVESKGGAAKGAPAPDPRFDRTPKERTALILIIPTDRGDAKVIITETVHGGRLALEVNGLDRDVLLNVRELRALAQMANKVAGYVCKRPEWRP